MVGKIPPKTNHTFPYLGKALHAFYIQENMHKNTKKQCWHILSWLDRNVFSPSIRQRL